MFASRTLYVSFPLPGMLFSLFFVRLTPSHLLKFSLRVTSFNRPSLMILSKIEPLFNSLSLFFHSTYNNLNYWFFGTGFCNLCVLSFTKIMLIQFDKCLFGQFLTGHLLWEKIMTRIIIITMW